MATDLPVHATVSYKFSVPPEKVFDAWLDTDMVGKFMFGPNVRDEEIVRLKIDKRLGGSFSFIVRRKGVEIDHLGEYLEVNRSHRLIFTWAVRDELPNKSRIVINITPLQKGCELTLTQEMSSDWASFVDSSKAAWMKMLTALDKAF